MQQQLPLRRSTLTPEQGEGEVGRVLLPGSDSGGERLPAAQERVGPWGEPGRLPFHVSSTLPFGFETKPEFWERILIKVQTLLFTAGVLMNAAKCTMPLSLKSATRLNSWP